LTNNRELMDRIGYNLSQGLVSSQHTASLVALFIALHEARLTGKAFAKQVVENARTLASRLAALGVPVLARSDGQFTDNHHFFINLTGVASAPHQMERLLRAHLVVQRGMPFRNVDALRVGVQEVTRRGYGPGEMAQLAEWIASIVIGGADPEVVAPAVQAMAKRFDTIYYTGETVDGKLDLPEIAAPSAKGRWVDYRHLGNDFAMDDTEFSEIRALGAAAGAFPNQTDSTGNVSLRSGARVFVSSSGSYIKHLADGQVVELDAVDPSGELIDYHGAALPSSESLMHFLVYQNVPAGAVVHTHYLLTNQEAADFDVAVIAPQEYASIALARAVAEASKRSRIVYIQKHGLVFWGTDTADCLSQVHNFIHNRPNRRAAEAVYAS
ncbi:MAG: class II aldolase/adducin family protein, partial [Deltaproteobacteria bacterium]|nr:class II aldolase/adducin family protein [Deltaproteobacteria bacterium]